MADAAVIPANTLARIREIDSQISGHFGDIQVLQKYGPINPLKELAIADIQGKVDRLLAERKQLLEGEQDF